MFSIEMAETVFEFFRRKEDGGGLDFRTEKQNSRLHQSQHILETLTQLKIKGRTEVRENNSCLESRCASSPEVYFCKQSSTNSVMSSSAPQDPASFSVSLGLPQEGRGPPLAGRASDPSSQVTSFTNGTIIVPTPTLMEK